MDKLQQQKEFKKRLYSFTLKLIETIDQLGKSDFVSRRLGDQLLRSGTSIIGNYIEGLAGASRKDMANYFSSSLKSSNESKLWICLLRDSNRLKSDRTKWLLKELDEYSKIFASSLLTLRGKRKQPLIFTF